MSDEFISPSEFVKSPRGRKTEWNADLLATLAKVTDKQGVRLSSTIGEVASEDRPAVSAMIRKHWRAARADEPSISYDANGIPQIEVRKAKRKR